MLSIPIVALLACLSISTTATKLNAIMIDAGSKGSRVHIYEWEVPVTDKGPSNAKSTPVIPRTVATLSVKPGVSSSALNISSIHAPLQTLIEFSQKELAHVKPLWSYIPMYFKATAGMRDLLPDKRDLVMNGVLQALRKSPFYFRDSFAQVISGEEEASFAWLTANAARNTLGSNSTSSSVGILDLGGASMQIAFEPPATHYVLQQFVGLSMVPHKQIRLYAKSYLHYGIVEASRRLDSLLIAENLLQVDSVREIGNPCYYKGMQYYPDFTSKKYQIPLEVHMVGTGDFDQCTTKLKSLFSKDTTTCWVRNCTFDGVYQPRLENQAFIGMTNLAKTAAHLGLGSTATIRDISTKAKFACGQLLSNIPKQFPAVSRSEDDINSLCFVASYVVTFLSYGLGFPMDGKQISFVESDPNGSKYGWTLGAIVYELNQLDGPDNIGKYTEAARTYESETALQRVASNEKQKWLMEPILAQ